MTFTQSHPIAHHRLLRLTVTLLVLAVVAAGLAACVPTPTPIGSFEAAYRASNGNATVIGWAGYPDTSRAVAITVTSAGRTVATATAVANRRDVASTFPILGPSHGFNITIPGGSSAVGTVCVTASDSVTKTVKSLGCRSLPSPTTAQPVPPAPVPENGVFSYESPNDPGYAATLGHPKWVVSTYDNGAPPAHAAGAKAFRYTQFTWFSSTGEWMGPMFANRAAWRCDLPGNPRRGDTWYYANQNLVGYTNAVIAYARTVKALGFDGIFLDVAGRAFGGPPAHVTCATPAGQHVVGPVLPTRDAYLRLIKTVHDTTGLQIAFNNPPPDIVARIKGWATFWLRENAANSRQAPGQLQIDSFIRDDAVTGGGQLLEMAKSGRRQTDPLKSSEETYVWALAKLSGQPVVLNTGYDECITDGGPGRIIDGGGCDRMGAVPDLIDARLGAAIGQIEIQGTIYLRRFEYGFAAVNVAPPGTPDAAMNLHLSKCRVLYRLRAGLLANGACVQDSVLRVGAQRGWIVTYR